MIEPCFAEKQIPICFSVDEKYVLYLCVAIQSLLDQASADCNYDIVVLYENLSPSSIRNIESLSGSANVSIRTYDVSGYMNDRFAELFVTKAYYTLPTYYRFFIPIIFRKYEKVIYLDCDLVVLRDVSGLLDVELGDNYLGAVRDLGVVQQLNTIKGWKEYFRDGLRIDVLENIFQAGVLIFNIAPLNKLNLLAACVEKLEKFPNPRVLDQCILNSVCEHRVRFLDLEWNVMWSLPFLAQDLEKELGSELYRAYLLARKDPFILHYVSSIKPWHEPQREMASYFWCIARNTPYYECILYRDLLNRNISLKERLFDLKFMHLIYRHLPCSFQNCLSWIKNTVMK